jgi:hypothetical protein
VLRRTLKTVLLQGTLDGSAVVAKVLTSSDDEWRTTFAREVAAYNIFATARPPAVVPRMHVADADARVLVIDLIDGLPASEERYPRDIPPATVDMIIAALTQLRAWSPPPGAFTRIYDYAARFDRYANLGIIEPRDLAALTGLLERPGDAWEFAHGDAVPANILLPKPGGVALIDWEFAGMYLPAYDLALLRVMLADVGDARRRIETAGDSPGFWINIAAVLIREIRLHRDKPARLAILEDDWHAAARRIRGL